MNENKDFKSFKRIFKYEIGDEVCLSQSHGFLGTEKGEIISRHFDVFGGNAYRVKLKTHFSGLILNVSEESIIKYDTTKKNEKLLELYKRLFNVCKEYKCASIGLSDDSEFLNVMSELEEELKDE